MSRICEVTGKKPMSGNHVSHANNRTRRRFLPNLQHRKFWIESEKRWINLRISNAALRTIDQNGIDAVFPNLYSDRPVLATAVSTEGACIISIFILSFFVCCKISTCVVADNGSP